jgi:FAD/FMN-containing dehydrogenase
MIVQNMDSTRDLPTALLSDIGQIIGSSNLKQGDAVANLDYGVTAANLGAAAVAFPSSTQDVAAIIKCAAQHGISVVPQGGRTGLVDGSVSAPGQIVLSTARLKRIVDLYPVERVAVVEAGVTLQALQTAASEHHLEPGIDLPSRGSATIGGMVSTNAGGISAFCVSAWNIDPSGGVTGVQF